MKQMKVVLHEYMSDIICQLNINRQTYKTAIRPTGRDGSVDQINGYDAS